MMLALPRAPSRLLVPLVAALAITWPAVARSENRDAATARALFDLGRQLLTSGRAREACPKLEESLRLAPGMGTRFNLAYCWQQTGRTASAWALFLEVAAAARAAGLAERESVARRLARELEPQLSYLAIDVAAPVPGLELSRDGTPLGPAAWGAAAPVDPGLHVLRATAPGKRAIAYGVRVPPQHVVVRVTLPRLEDDPVAEHLSARRWAGIGLAAGAALGLAAGAVFTARVHEERDAAESLCPEYRDSGCSARDVAEQERLLARARSQRTGAITSFGIGGAAAIGAVLLLTGTSGGGERARRLEVTPLAGGWGATLTGAW